MRLVINDPAGSSPHESEGPPRVLLSPLAWADYSYKTLYAVQVDAGGQRHDIGLTKIIHLEGLSQPASGTYDSLPEGHVSLLQGADGYDAADEAGLADPILRAVRDLSTLDDGERAALLGLDLVQRTLFRLTTARHALNHRLGRPCNFMNFAVTHKVEGFVEPHRVHFRFDGDAVLERMVVLIGRNGAGKTRLLRGLLYPMLGIRRVSWDGSGLEEAENPPAFSVVIQMSFSAFDTFSITRGPLLDSLSRYCGLRTRKSDWGSRTNIDIEGSFASLDKALTELIAHGREDDWRRDMEEHGLRFDGAGHFSDWLEHRSAGQKFVGFALTNLHATLKPGALLLFDEPEIHSHPRMLTVLMRQLHTLLERHNAFSIVATHSPIVLQESPGKQVRILSRHEGGFPSVKPYSTECFGESLDDIIDLGFQLDAPERNFGHHLQRLVEARGVEAVEQAIPRMGLAARLRLEQLQHELDGEEA